MLGPELAAIFAIFTSQAWNIVLSFYQSLRTVPSELREAVKMLQLSGWQSFWRVDVPFAMPGLLWNIMMSMSASWFFVVAAEAITVSNQNILLPGIGSYISLAVLHANKLSVVYAILTMLVVILLYDQLLFRPLNNWAERFKFEQTSGEETQTALLVRLFEHTNLFRHTGKLTNRVWDAFVNIPFLYKKETSYSLDHEHQWQKYVIFLWYLFITVAIAIASYILIRFVFETISLQEGGYVLYLGLITGARVMILIFLCSVLWIPIGVWIGFRPKLIEFFQPIIQILAAFPANLFFPVVVMIIVKYHFNPEIWVSPLMVLGTQWYILFNVIAGASTLPKDIRQVVHNFNVRGWVRWKKFILPGIFPYYVTGAITAAGGAWNASIIAEAVSWGHDKIIATGLGAYITESATRGDFQRLALGTTVMSLFVVVINRLLWKPLYNLAEERFRIE
jgi:NitT/TauT family transport system permease protein